VQVRSGRAVRDERYCPDISRHHADAPLPASTPRKPVHKRLQRIISRENFSPHQALRGLSKSPRNHQIKPEREIKIMTSSSKHRNTGTSWTTTIIIKNLFDQWNFSCAFTNFFEDEASLCLNVSIGCAFLWEVDRRGLYSWLVPLRIITYSWRAVLPTSHQEFFTIHPNLKKAEPEPLWASCCRLSSPLAPHK